MQAAEMTGLTRQTIQNWIDKGVLNCIVVGKAHFLDSDTLESLFDDLQDVEKSRLKLKEIKQEYEAKQQEYGKKIKDLKDCLFLFDDDVLSSLRKRFYLSYPSMLSSIDLISVNEMNILNDIIAGYSIEYICEERNLTLAQITKIAKSAISKMSKLRSYVVHCKSSLERNYDILDELKSAHHTIELLKKELDTLSEYRFQKESIKEYEEAYYQHLLLKTKLENMNLVQRVQTVFKENHIETLGDLVNYNRNDILKLHGVGKTCMKEMEDLLESLNLSFGMNTDWIEENYNLYQISLRERCKTLIPILNTNLEETDLRQKWYYESLLMNDIVTIGDLASRFSFEIKDIIELDGDVEEIESFLESYGLHFDFNVKAIYKEYELMNIQSSIDREKEEAKIRNLVGIWDIEQIECIAEDKEPDFFRRRNGAYWEITIKNISIHDEPEMLDGRSYDYTLKDWELNIGGIVTYTVTELTNDKLVVRSQGKYDSCNIVTFKKRND